MSRKWVENENLILKFRSTAFQVMTGTWNAVDIWDNLVVQENYLKFIKENVEKFTCHKLNVDNSASVASIYDIGSILPSYLSRIQRKKESITITLASSNNTQGRW